MSENNSAVPADLGEEIGGPGRAYFEDVFKDNIMDALLEVSARLWTVEDRMMVLEKVLEDKGVSVTEAIEQHTPDAEELARRGKARQEFVEAVLGGFIRRPQ